MVTISTKITAEPNPTAVFTVFETAKYEHIPKKKVKIILSIKALFINILMYSIILSIKSFF